jgi:hypothetical protein
MATISETDMRALEGALSNDFIAHLYPRKPPYRRSGISPPQIGDVALCGWVKEEPPVGRAAAEKFPLCARCACLREMRA